MNELDPTVEPKEVFQSSRMKELRGHVYNELRKLANINMRNEKSPHTLQPTALIHEAWLRMGGDKQQDWKSRAEFFASAAESMRRILVERARRKKAVRYGGHLQNVEIEDWDALADLGGQAGRADEKILILHEALEQMALDEPKLAELVKLHYFAGLTNVEAAEALDLSERTVQRWLAFARAWLKGQMESLQKEESSPPET